MNEIILKTVDLRKRYFIQKHWLGKQQAIQALNGINMEIRRGEVFGVVGESGCGKTTLAMTIARLLEADEGEIFFEGQNITRYSEKQTRKMRKSTQMIFQDPYASLNPRVTIREIIAEPLRIQKLTKNRQQTDERVEELLRQVGMDESQADRYPREFSGGQRQRIGIARALAVQPSFVIADEPVSALDVSVQSRILNLMSSLKKELDLTYMFISHDLSVVKFISDRVGVMYLGDFVETADKDELYNNPLHPYTKALLSAVPIPDPFAKREKKIILEGNVYDTERGGAGCGFCDRCYKRIGICSKTPPPLVQISVNHMVSCHLYA